MAAKVTHIGGAKAKPDAPKFNDVHRDIASVKVSEAQAVCRVVSLATAALIDESVQYPDSNAYRWRPAIETARARIQEVGNILVEVLDPPKVDWWTPLCLLEALGAAMWHCDTPGGDATIFHDELEAFMRVIRGSLDDLAKGLSNG